MMFVSNSPEETQKIATEQAQFFVTAGKGQTIFIALEGELGAGKTTFTQAFAQALGIKENLKSPTFVLMKDYQLENVPHYHHLYHFDCYRLNNATDLAPLGAKEIIETPGNIILMEWAERVTDIIPKNHWLIHIDHIAEQVRNISITQK